jgi:hypothetical protein
MSDQTEALQTAYEVLRNHVLTSASASAGGHAGLVVLLRQGLAAWMARRFACVDPAPIATRTSTPCTSTSLLSGAIHADIVRVLASMVLPPQPEQCV